MSRTVRLATPDVHRLLAASRPAADDLRDAFIPVHAADDVMWGSETPSRGLLDTNGNCAKRLPALPRSAPREPQA
jgi:hypothetical protein